MPMLGTYCNEHKGYEDDQEEPVWDEEDEESPVVHGRLEVAIKPRDEGVPSRHQPVKEHISQDKLVLESTIKN